MKRDEFHNLSIAAADEMFTFCAGILGAFSLATDIYISTLLAFYQDSPSVDGFISTAHIVNLSTTKNGLETQVENSLVSSRKKDNVL